MLIPLGKIFLATLLPVEVTVETTIFSLLNLLWSNSTKLPALMVSPTLTACSQIGLLSPSSFFSSAGFKKNLMPIGARGFLLNIAKKRYQKEKSIKIKSIRNLTIISLSPWDVPYHRLLLSDG